MTEDDLLDYERDLACLYEPFPSLVRLYRNQHLMFTPNATNAKKEDGEDKVQIKAVPISSGLGKNTDILTVTRLLVLGLLVVSLLENFYRSVSLDMLICFLFILLYQNQLLDTRKCKGLMICVGISTALSLIWLDIFGTVKFYL